MEYSSNKLLIICGPTATGKTALALSIAKQFHGELVSADSRQVYIGMDIGTGKDVGKNSKFKIQNSKIQIKNKKYQYGYYDIEGITLWLLDVARPDQEFSVAHYREVATRTIQDIQTRGKLAIIVGGTGLYIKALIEPIDTINIPQNLDLRDELSKKNTIQLQKLLKYTNLARWKKMNNSDRHNSRRLIRAIEVERYLAHRQSKREDNSREWNMKNSNILQIGLTATKEALYTRIDERIDERVRQGIIEEIRSLLAKGYSWDLPSMSGLGYREFKDYFTGKAELEEIINRWKLHEHAYARRQMTWFKKQRAINCFDITDPSFSMMIQRLVRSWYTESKF